MNAKKAKALRKLVKSFTGKLADHSFKEMGTNTKMEEDGIAVERMVRITAPVTVASDTKRGQLIAMKKAIKAEYGRNKK